MKVLLLCNVVIPQIAIKANLPVVVTGGWLISLVESIKSIDDIQLAICAPVKKECSKIEWDGIEFYGFTSNMSNQKKYYQKTENVFRGIINEYKPDIVHIFGTEFAHTLAMVKAFNCPEKTMIHIQGLVSVISKHYFNGLTHKQCKAYTLRDFYKRDNIYKQAVKLKQRGIFEIEAIKRVKHVTGRTEWDKACVLLINPDCIYHHCNEILRKEFYNGQWNYKQCEKHTIFISQGSSPIKGLHFALEAVAILKSKYTDIKLYLTGNDLFDKSNIKTKIHSTYYSTIIKKKIIALGLVQNIVFLGSLCADDMKNMYLKVNVAVSPSIIENSSNSICEAMILGTPVVASYVGGTPSLLEHGKEGYLYQADAPYMLAYYVDKIFECEDTIENITNAAVIRAKKRHSVKTILDDVKSIYTNIIE